MNHLTLAEPSLRASSKLTARCQTTIPASVRDAMKLAPGEEIEYSILAGGEVLIKRKESNEETDPVIAGFLHFLSEDMLNNPSRIKPLDASTVARARALTEGMDDVDLDGPLSD